MKKTRFQAWQWVDFNFSENTWECLAQKATHARHVRAYLKKHRNITFLPVNEHLTPDDFADTES